MKDSSEGEPRLLVRRNEKRVRLESPWLTESLRSLRLLAKALAPLPNQIGIELDVMPVLTFRRYQKALPDVVWHDPFHDSG